MRNLCNADVRAEVKRSGVFLWQIAEHMNISEPTLTRKLRHELSDSDKKQFRDIIAELKSENE